LNYRRIAKQAAAIGLVEVAIKINRWHRGVMETGIRGAGFGGNTADSESGWRFE
jgi:hypothetical protein